MKDIPPEILTRIFWFAHDEMQPFYQTRNSPWLPASVCRQWRHVALSSPEIWSNVYIPPDMINTPETLVRSFDEWDEVEWAYETLPRRVNPAIIDSFRRLLCIMLDRSKGHPLRISLSADDSVDTLLAQAILEPLWAHRSRWGVLLADGYLPSNVTKQILAAPAAPMDRLHTLSLRSPNGSSQYNVMKLVQSIKAFSSLSALTLRVSVLGEMHVDLLQSVPWRNLRTLCLSFEAATAGALSQVFNRLDSVAFLDIRYPSHRPRIPLPDSDTYLLPNLKRLLTNCNQFLVNFTAPQLVVLDAKSALQVLDSNHSLREASVSDQPHRAQDIRSLVVRSQCPIQYLRIWHLEIGLNDGPTDLFIHMSLLRVLSVCGADFATFLAVTQQLRGDSPQAAHDHRPPCPALAAIYIRYLHKEEDPESPVALLESIADLLETRWWRRRRRHSITDTPAAWVDLTTGERAEACELRFCSDTGAFSTSTDGAQKSLDRIRTIAEDDSVDVDVGANVHGGGVSYSKVSSLWPREEWKGVDLEVLPGAGFDKWMRF